MAAPRLAVEDLADIQGFLTSGYGHLPQSAYLFVQFHDSAQARRWLAQLAPVVTTAKPWPKNAKGEKIKPAVTLNVAFTCDGLAALGLPREVLCTFPEEFQEGIATPARSRILGDTEESDATRWEFGGAGQPPIHALVVVHAATQEAVEWACGEQRQLIEKTAGGVVEVADSAQRGYRPSGDHEPFGFHDGVGQPSVAGINGDGVPTGEFILGYENHYQVIPPTPVVAASLSAGDVLPEYANPYHATARLRDLGLNGSFLVYRKLQQDVAGFWQFVKREADRSEPTDDPCRMVWIAARMVGRWPSGTALTLSAETDDARLRERNDFVYRDDPAGLRCPIGAHIRRTNPRDDVKPYPAAESLSMTEAHRILRRARVFGPTLFDPTVLADPTSDACRAAILALADDGRARGIHFFAVNASIRSQFEFIQQTWCNNPRFGGLHDSKDPITADNNRTGEPSSHMVIPQQPRALRTAALPRFVTVKAGAYLFMPSVRALRFLSSFG
jgi:Dyp-type peroxidase family